MGMKSTKCEVCTITFSSYLGYIGHKMDCDDGHQRFGKHYVEFMKAMVENEVKLQSANSGNGARFVDLSFAFDHGYYPCSTMCGCCGLQFSIKIFREHEIECKGIYKSYGLEYKEYMKNLSSEEDASISHYKFCLEQFLLFEKGNSFRS